MVLKELNCKFLFWECVVVLKELIVTELILTIYTLAGCGGLERNPFLSVSTQGGYDGLERTDLSVSMLGGCGGLERTHF